MAELSRRHLVVSGLAGAGASLLPVAINEANAATFTRYNLASANGQVMLKKYAQAVKLMMALPPSNPLSWTFQWYTHAVPSNTTKAAQISSIFGPNPSPNKTLATAMWNTCQAHFNQADEPYFLPWHRMYVCYFEDIIRTVLKDPKFTLPYWNYTSPAGYPVPKEFRMQNDPLWGPLFRPNRNPTSNAGQPIFAAGGSVAISVPGRRWRKANICRAAWSRASTRPSTAGFMATSTSSPAMARAWVRSPLRRTIRSSGCITATSIASG